MQDPALELLRTSSCMLMSEIISVSRPSECNNLDASAIPMLTSAVDMNTNARGNASATPRHKLADALHPCVHGGMRNCKGDAPEHAIDVSCSRW